MATKELEIEYRIDYSERRKTVSFIIERNGDVVVKAPTGTDLRNIERMVQAKKMNIYEKINHPQKIKITRVNPSQINGRSILYSGKNYKAYVNNSTKDEFIFKGKFIISANIKNQFDKKLADWLMDSAKEKLTAKVIEYSKRLGVNYNRIFISDLQLRWGSCTPINNINLNYRLIKAPVFVYNYIIVHELAHLLVNNHTEEFWRIVRTAYPKYEKAREWLKINGNSLFN